MSSQSTIVSICMAQELTTKGVKVKDGDGGTKVKEEGFGTRNWSTVREGEDLGSVSLIRKEKMDKEKRGRKRKELKREGSCS